MSVNFGAMSNLKEKPGGLKILTLEGTPYNRGLIHGIAMRGQIHATATDDAGLFERIMRIYVKTGLRAENTPLDSLTCRGCSPENTWAYSVVRDCALARKFGNCGECSDYPCDELSRVFQKTEDFRNRVEQVCTKEEFALFERAFFRKKECLNDAANKESPDAG